tara:strand:+ start:1131 stop:1523 length:393 start_codon:yes stop_codon:yes gene_type:complete
MKLRITYLVAAIDRDIGTTDPSYLKVLVDEDGKPPSKYITTKDESETLKSLHSEYINYHFEYASRLLCGFRKLNAEEFEVCYASTVSYLPDFNKKGIVGSFSSLFERGILVEEYYADLFSKFGATSLGRR